MTTLVQTPRYHLQQFICNQLAGCLTYNYQQGRNRDGTWTTDVWRSFRLTHHMTKRGFCFLKYPFHAHRHDCKRLT